MAFEDHAPSEAKPTRTKSSTDDMVALGHMAGKNPKATRKIEKTPLPKEARRGLLIALGVVVLLVIVAILRARS